MSNVYSDEIEFELFTKASIIRVGRAISAHARILMHFVDSARYIIFRVSSYNRRNEGR